jgi:hypothetical protein
MHPTIQMTENRLRIQEMERRASLRASLGELPGHASMRPFRRRINVLSGPVEIRHAPAPAASESTTLPHAA